MPVAHLELGKQNLGENKTSVIFFLGSHTSDSVKIFKEYVEKNTPNIIVLEHPDNEKFNRMIEGKITVAEYMKVEGRNYLSSDSSRRKFEFLREMHKRGVRIETLTSESLAGGNASLKLSKDAAFEELSSSLQNGDFNRAVRSCLNFLEIFGVEAKLRDQWRAQEIAEKVRSGEWKGNILIEAGAIHTQAKNILIDELKGMDNVNVSSVYSFREIASRVFKGSISEVYPPGDELIRIHTYEATKRTSVDEEKEKLLGARSIIHFLMTKSLASEVGVETEYTATKLVNQLSYGECETLFNKVQKMDQESAYKFVEDYLRKKDKK